jgi:hypothetical protein
MTLIQRNRYLNRFWIVNRFDSTGFVFNQFEHPCLQMFQASLSLTSMNLQKRVRYCLGSRHVQRQSGFRDKPLIQSL